MKFTAFAEKSPLKEGYYWIRMAGSDVARVAYVQMIVTYVSESMGGCCHTIMGNDEWAGPIEQPGYDVPPQATPPDVNATQGPVFDGYTR
jgi:hypothetical protein